jgi:hypothetical protein
MNFGMVIICRESLLVRLRVLFSLWLGGPYNLILSLPSVLSLKGILLASGIKSDVMTTNLSHQSISNR